MATVKMTPAEFQQKRAALKNALTKGLKKELSDCAWEPEPGTDLWELPTVDSKTVCKLSPIVEEMTGQKLKAVWIRKGGYGSVDEAVTDLMARIAEHCVAQNALAA